MVLPFFFQQRGTPRPYICLMTNQGEGWRNEKRV